MEADILLWIQDSLRNPIFDPIMKFVTHLGDSGKIWILMAIIFLVLSKDSKKNWTIGSTILIALLGSLLINNLILKNLIARTRPYEAIEGLYTLVARPKDLSFPSGHSASSFAAATVIYLMAPKYYGIPAVVLATAIALSRLYVGVHYPTDVLGGIVSGILLGIASVWLAKETFAKEKLQ